MRAAGTSERAPVSADPERALPLKLFINYRHEDLEGTVWGIYARLTERFGIKNVFFDKGSLQPGMRWFEEIKSHLSGSGIFLLLIGPSWMTSLTARMQSGGDDYVAREIDLAFQSAPDVIVIPVLVGHTVPPAREALPPALRPICELQMETLRYTDLLADLDELIRSFDGAGAARRLGRGQQTAPASPAPGPAPVPSGGAPPRPAAGLPASDPLAAVVGPPRQIASAPGDDHYQTVVEEAENLVIFLGADVNADDHDGTWPEASGSVPDDAELARYLAQKIRLSSDHLDLAEAAQHVRTLRGESHVYKWMREVLAAPTPGPVQRYLAGFPKRLAALGLPSAYQMIVTPKYDAALERALKSLNEPFDVAVFMAPGTAQGGSFLHLPWNGAPTRIANPNDYLGFPITEDGRLSRTVVVRIHGAVDDRDAGYVWRDNYVITEDHYIDYLSSRTPEDLVPGQILAKLRDASCLFLGYKISDWRLRVFLKRIFTSDRIGRGRSWAVEREPDELARQLWLGGGVELFQSRLTSYCDALDAYLAPRPAGSRR